MYDRPGQEIPCFFIRSPVKFKFRWQERKHFWEVVSPHYSEQLPTLWVMSVDCSGNKATRKNRKAHGIWMPNLSLCSKDDQPFACCCQRRQARCKPYLNNVSIQAKVYWLQPRRRHLEAACSSSTLPASARCFTPSRDCYWKFDQRQHYG